MKSHESHIDEHGPANPDHLPPTPPGLLLVLIAVCFILGLLGLQKLLELIGAL